MKRIFSLIVVLVMAVSMVGCTDAAKDSINKSLSRGVVDGNTYTSEYIGVSFVKPDAWVYSTEEEINELMGAGAEIMDYSDYEAAVTELVTVFDMMATDPNTGNNINIVFENLTLSGSTDITEDEYIEVSKTNFESISDLVYTFGDVETVTLGGVEFKKLPASVTFLEFISMEQNLYIKKIGNYMAIVNITIVDGSDASVIEGYFSEIK